MFPQRISMINFSLIKQVGAVPGGSFEFIAANGKTILVSVPTDAIPGGFIDVCIDEDEDGMSHVLHTYEYTPITIHIWCLM